MQMYHGLPIITNKISVEEQKGIPHHLLGVVGLDEETWRVGLFKRNADRIIREIRERGKLPILVGGTHYYTQSLLFEKELVESTEDIPNSEISDRFPILDASTEEILTKLREVDPVMADRWHPNDRRKIRRSLEIYLMNGKQASRIYKEQKQEKEAEEQKDEPSPSDSEGSLKLRSPTLLFWVHAEDKILKARLDDRVDNMIQAGLLEEVRTLNEYLQEQESTGIKVDKSRGIWVSIGFKEFEPYLAITRNEASTEKEMAMSLHNAVEQTKGATRRYAKRQISWIRIKLMTALLEAKAADKLYLLDGSDLSRWTESVSNPAIKITGDFLAGKEIPVPSSLSPTAEELLSTEKAEEKVVIQTGVPFRQECAMCNSIFVVERQWLLHLKSRTHRRMTKKSVQRSMDFRTNITED